MADADKTTKVKTPRARKPAAKKKPARKKAPAAPSKRKKGNGKGWGGPKKGAGKPTPGYKFKQAGPGRGNYSIEGEGRLERQARHAELMRGIYFEFALNEVLPPETRMTAATHLLNRTEGLPVQKIVNAETDPLSLLPDNELVSEIEKQRAIVAGFEADREADAANP
jgi:hypothetical protein